MTASFHTAQPDWHACVYVFGDPPGWTVRPVIGWLVDIQEPVDPYGSPDPDGDAFAWARPVLMDGEGSGGPEDHVLMMLEPGEMLDNYVAELDAAVVQRTKFVIAERNRRAARAEG